MKLPDPKSFPELTPGYAFHVDFDEVDQVYAERLFNVYVVHLENVDGTPLTSELHVPERNLTSVAKDLAKRAHLLASVDRTQDQVKRLNKALRERASR